MKPGETKQDFSKRVATRRVNEILDKIRKLENLAGPNYNLTSEQVNKIFEVLNKAYEGLKMSFKERTEFTLEGSEE